MRGQPKQDGKPEYPQADFGALRRACAPDSIYSQTRYGITKEPFNPRPYHEPLDLTCQIQRHI